MKKLTQLLRHRLVVGQTDLVEEVEGGHVEKGQVQNVDEEVAEENRENDPYEVMLMTTAKTMKLAKKMSMSKVDAKRCREEGMDLVVELCEEGICSNDDDGDVSLWRGVVVGDRQSGVGDDVSSATMSNPRASDGCSKMGLILKSWGCRCRRCPSMHGR